MFQLMFGSFEKLGRTPSLIEAFSAQDANPA